MGALRLKSRQWIVDDKDRIIIGEGRSRILEIIDKTGSINKTAKIMKMSYKGVWSKIKATEKYMKLKLVETDKRKGSWLTPEGRALLKKYKDLKRRCLQEEDRIFRSIFG